MLTHTRMYTHVLKCIHTDLLSLSLHFLTQHTQTSMHRNTHTHTHPHIYNTHKQDTQRSDLVAVLTVHGVWEGDLGLEHLPTVHELHQQVAHGLKLHLLGRFYIRENQSREDLSTNKQWEQGLGYTLGYILVLWIHFIYVRGWLCSHLRLQYTNTNSPYGASSRSLLVDEVERSEDWPSMCFKWHPISYLVHYFKRNSLNREPFGTWDTWLKLQLHKGGE
jgi:hypothetical protein